MEYRILGKSGLKVSQLGFGCMRLPVDGPDPSYIDEDLSARMIMKAVEGGVNYVDTAWPYHGASGRDKPGQSEPVVGVILEEHKLRNKVHLVTKLPSWLVESRAQMDRLLDEQLKRLRTSHLDLYLVHNLNLGNFERLKGLMLYEFLDAAKKDGRVKHVGFSFHDRYEAFADIVGDYDWEVAQIQYNYLDQEYQAGAKGLKLAASKGLGLAIMEPLRGGFLVHHLPLELKERLKKARPGWSLAEWCLRWLWDQPEPGVVLSGMSDMAQVEENLAVAAKAAAGQFTAEDKEAVDEVRRGLRERIAVDCTGCGYCLPCPSGVGIPKVFLFYNDYYLFNNDETRARAKFCYGAQMLEDEKAGACVSCGECLEKCPQHLPIPDLMEKAADLFGS